MKQTLEQIAASLGLRIERSEHSFHHRVYQGRRLLGCIEEPDGGSGKWQAVTPHRSAESALEAIARAAPGEPLCP